MQLDFRSISRAARDHFIQHCLFSWPSHKLCSSSSTTASCPNVNSYLIRLNLPNFSKHVFSCCSFLATLLVNVILWNMKLFSYVQADLPIQDMEPKIFSTEQKENFEVFKSLKELTKGWSFFNWRNPLVYNLEKIDSFTKVTEAKGSVQIHIQHYSV